ncbi:MAG: FkbM family methyltransferase [Deltaproteobacteria bacterium]|nr:FkbM family methyltransferase [Kofleriaceae bacterium]
MSALSARLRPAYLRARAAVRGFVVRHPTIDLTVGRSLVQIDLLLRRLGLVSVADADQREFTFEGCRFRFDSANRDVAMTVLATGEYEGATLAAIRALVGRDGTFVDLGANLGFFTVLVGRDLSPTGRVHAFEPTPATAALLRENVAANGVSDRVTVVEQAVSDQPGRARFSLYDAAQANQLAVAGTDGSSGSIEVAVTTLDEYFEALGWPRVDVVKMDVEGVETKVLDGMRELIRRQPELRIIFEYHLGQLDRAHVSGASLIEKVRELGFNRFEMLFRGREPIELPAEHERLDRQAWRANLNLLAWRAD